MNSNYCAARLFAYAIMLAAILTVISLPIYAAKGKNKNVKPKQTKLWRQINQSEAQMKSEQPGFAPEKYLVFRLV